MPEACQRPPARTSPVHFRVSKTRGLTHHCRISLEANAAKTRSGDATTSMVARISPCPWSATAFALPFVMPFMSLR